MPHHYLPLKPPPTVQHLPATGSALNRSHEAVCASVFEPEDTGLFYTLLRDGYLETLGGFSLDIFRPGRFLLDYCSTSVNSISMGP